MFLGLEFRIILLKLKKIKGVKEMKKNTRWLTILIICLFALTAIVGCSSPAAAPTAPTAPAEPEPKFPEKPFEMLVPMGAGGGSDVFVRQLVKVIEDNKFTSQPIVVVNKPGGSGSIGWSYVANDHKGDPYELSTVSSSFYTGPLSGKSPVTYEDFTHIAALCVDPNLIVVAADSKYQTIDDLVKDAKANPGKVSAGGSSGLSVDAIIFYSFEDLADVDMKYVPFEGGGEVMTAVLGQHTNWGILGPSETIEQINAGKMRALAVTNEERLEGALKDIPTMKESGYDVVMAQTRGVVAPKGISAEEAKYLEEMVLKAAATPEWKKFVADNFMEETLMNSEEFLVASKRINDSFAKYLDQVGK